jgi:hypothetical protein
LVLMAGYGFDKAGQRLSSDDPHDAIL